MAKKDDDELNLPDVPLPKGDDDEADDGEDGEYDEEAAERDRRNEARLAVLRAIEEEGAYWPPNG